jgi:hypothetical protein
VSFVANLKKDEAIRGKYFYACHQDDLFSRVLAICGDSVSINLRRIYEKGSDVIKKRLHNENTNADRQEVYK